MIERVPPAFRKLVLYAVCGGCGVLLDLGVYTGLVMMGVWYQMANLAGYASGTLLSFVLNRAITFQVKDAPLRRLGMFIMVAVAGYTVSTGVLWLLVEQLGVGPLLSKLVTLVIVLALQFTLNSLITFRADAPTRAREPTSP